MAGGTNCGCRGWSGGLILAGDHPRRDSAPYSFLVCRGTTGTKKCSLNLFMRWKGCNIRVQRSLKKVGGSLREMLK